MFAVEAISKREKCNVLILSMNLQLGLAVFSRML